MSRFLRNNEAGVILIITFVAMAVLIVITGIFLYLLSTRLRSAGNNLADSKAFWLAEAGIQKAIYRLQSESGFRNSPTTVSASFGSGTYSVSVSKSGTTYTLTSTGTVAQIQREISQSVDVSSVAVLNKAIYSDARENGIDFDGSSGTVNGDIASDSSVSNYSEMDINGTISQNAPALNPVVDYSYYSSIAGHNISGNYTFSSNTYTGIWYVSGDCTIRDNVRIEGALICGQDVIFQYGADNFFIDPKLFSDEVIYPAIVAGDDISSNDSSSLLTSSTINGLVLAEDYIRLDDLRTATFNGSIVAKGSIRMQEGSGFTVNYDSSYLSGIPSITFTDGEVTVTAQNNWQEVN